MTSLCIATPVYGHPSTASVSAIYLNGLLSMCKSVETIPVRLLGDCDLVRARSRAVRMFLDRSESHLLFWDADIGGAGVPDVLRGMFAEEKDFIAAPYARKLYRPGYSTKSTAQANGYVGMGFTLLTRAMLVQMRDHYSPELTFLDSIENARVATCALFMLMIRDGVLLGEDYSFCQRWKDIGGEVWLYQGPGLPLEHVGGHAYK